MLLFFVFGRRHFPFLHFQSQGATCWNALHFRCHESKKTHEYKLPVRVQCLNSLLFNQERIGLSLTRRLQAGRLGNTKKKETKPKTSPLPVTMKAEDCTDDSSLESDIVGTLLTIGILASYIPQASLLRHQFAYTSF